MCKFLCGRGFISLAYIPSVRIGGSHGNTIVLLWRNYRTISKGIAPFYIPPTVYEVLLQLNWTYRSIGGKLVTLQYCYYWSINTVYVNFLSPLFLSVIFCSLMCRIMTILCQIYFYFFILKCIVDFSFLIAYCQLIKIQLIFVYWLCFQLTLLNLFLKPYL